MISPYSMLKIQELPGAKPLEPHRGSGLDTAARVGALFEGMPPPPPANTPSGSSPDDKPVLTLLHIFYFIINFKFLDKQYTVFLDR